MSYDAFLSHISSACGFSSPISDPRYVIEKCIESNALLNAYAVINYIINAKVGIPRVHIVPPSCVPNIYNICVINPETLLLMNVELLGIPKPASVVIHLRSSDEEKKEILEVELPSIWGVVISYRDITKNMESQSVVIFVYTEGVGEYISIIPPSWFAEKMLDICSEGSQKTLFEPGVIDELRSKSSLVKIERKEYTTK